jgi:hypothetical protein
VNERRAELSRVLGSDLFERSHNLQKLLSYLCEKAFSGTTGEVKEYTVAVEALGRSPDFDQKKDSIVRVEVHRLRKRLNQYYEGPGKDSPMRISIPEGKYIPVFSAAKDALAPMEPAPVVAERGPARLTHNRLGWAATLILAGSIVAAALIANSRRGSSSAPSPPAASVLPSAGVPEIRILAGRTRGYVDILGNTWEADAYFTGGSAHPGPHPPIRNATDQALFNGFREGDFQYDIPLEPGHYEMRLYFAETTFGEGNAAGGGESTRLFNFYANGEMLENLFDVLADAPGPRVADVRVYKNIRPAEDGKLHLEFKSVLHHAPFVNAIEIRRSTPARIRPVRLIASASPVRDSEGRTWLPDEIVDGGNLVKRSNPAEGTPVPELFQSERFGNFRYSIPVARNGVYRATLYFHEAWFGEGNSGGMGEGARIFDVHVNHQPLLVNFDILRASGGPRRAYVKTFHGLRPNPRGKLVLEFEPKVNYACVNAIEIEDETPVQAR